MSFSHRTEYEKEKFQYYSPRVPERTDAIFKVLPHQSMNNGRIESDSEYSLRLYTYQPISPNTDVEITSSDGADGERVIHVLGTVIRSIRNREPQNETERHMSFVQIHRVH